MSTGSKRNEINQKKKSKEATFGTVKNSLKEQKTSILLSSSLHQNFGFSCYVNLRNAKNIQVNAYKN